MRYLAAGAFCLIVASGGTAFGQTGSAMTPKTADRAEPGLVLEAQVAMATGKYEAALDIYSRLLVLNPNNAFYYERRGAIFEQQKRYDFAIAQYGKAIERNPNVTQFYLSRCRAYARAEDYGHALPDCSEAIKRDPEWAVPYNVRASVYIAGGDNGKAVADYDQAIQRDASVSDAFSGRALAKLRQRQYDESLADFSEAIRLAPQIPFYRFQRGTAYASKGDMEHAIEDYNGAIALKPDYVAAFAARGDIRRMRKDYIHALSDLDATIQLDSKSPMAAVYYGSRGATYSDMHNYERAMSDFAASLRLMPGFVNTLNARCWTRAVANKEIDEAIADCDAALAVAKGESMKVAILDSRGLAHFRKGALQKSLADYDAAFAIIPKAVTLYARGIVKNRMGRDGAKDIADALKMDPKAGDLMAEAGIKP